MPEWECETCKFYVKVEPSTTWRSVIPYDGICIARPPTAQWTPEGKVTVWPDVNKAEKCGLWEYA